MITKNVVQEEIDILSESFKRNHAKHIGDILTVTEKGSTFTSTLESVKFIDVLNGYRVQLILKNHTYEDRAVLNESEARIGAKFVTVTTAVSE